MATESSSAPISHATTEVFNLEVEKTSEDQLCSQDIPRDKYGSISMHMTGRGSNDGDTWQQVGLMLVMSFNCGYVLSFSNLMLVPLGWTWGILSLVVVGLYTAYANWLLAAFHFIEDHRFIRYRDIMGYLFGRKMYYITWVFQFLTLLLGNMGFILLGGRALKEINGAFREDPLRLQYWIMTTGAAYFVFSFMIPTMSAMRRWLGVSTLLTIGYISMLFVVLIKDGKTNKEGRSYEVSGGSSAAGRVFNAFGAISAIIVCNTSGLLLEIQSTLRQPVVENMRKALHLQYSVGLALYYGVSVAGYWAYGSKVSEYLPQQLNGPNWVKVSINAAVFLQSVISQHMFVTPIHETLDTKFLKLDESMHSRDNIRRLFLLRALLFAANTTVTAAFPFMGDFVNLFGSFTLVPLTFVFPSFIFLKVKGKSATTTKKAWHVFNVVLFLMLAVATTISAIRLIVNNIRHYSFFADA